MNEGGAGPHPGPIGRAKRLDDADLVRLARDGDVTAYEQLVRRYQSVAVRTAYVLTGSAAVADDVAQEAFIKAFGALPRFEATRPFRPWLLRIVANEAHNRRDADARHATLALRLADHSLQREPPNPPETAALAHERRATLLAAISALERNDREAIACRYFLDLSEVEMSEVLGLARGTVKSRLGRALARLRARLDPNAFDQEHVHE